jgi:hypothetical protein
MNKGRKKNRFGIGGKGREQGKEREVKLVRREQALSLNQ